MVNPIPRSNQALAPSGAPRPAEAQRDGVVSCGMTLQAHNAAKAEYDRSAALRIRAGPSNPPAREITTFKERVSVIKITSLTILSASLFRLSPSFSRRLYHAESLWLGSLRKKPILKLLINSHEHLERQAYHA